MSHFIILCPLPSVLCPESCYLNPESCFLCLLSSSTVISATAEKPAPHPNTLPYPVSFVQCPVSRVLNPVKCVLNPESWILFLLPSVLIPCLLQQRSQPPSHFLILCPLLSVLCPESCYWNPVSCAFCPHPPWCLLQPRSQPPHPITFFQPAPIAHIFHH